MARYGFHYPPPPQRGGGGDRKVGADEKFKTLCTFCRSTGPGEDRTCLRGYCIVSRFLRLHDGPHVLATANRVQQAYVMGARVI